MVHSMSSENGVDADGDSCYDILPFMSVTGAISTVITIPELKVPCSSYDAESDMVQLQFCSSWRNNEEENVDCDLNGAAPCAFDGCACEVVDLGVEIISPEDAVSTVQQDQVQAVAE